MDSILIRLCSWLVDVYLASAVLMVLAIGLNHFIRQPIRRIMAARIALVLTVGLAAAAAMPTWSRFSLHWFTDSQPVNTIELPPERMELVRPNGEGRAAAPVAKSLAAVRNPLTVSPATIGFRLDVPQAIAIVFLFASSLIGLWLAVGRLLVQRLIWASEPAAPRVEKLWLALTGTRIGGSSRWVRLLTNVRLAQPVASGLASPAILLPRTIETEEENCRAALAHEWEHIRRGDLWVLALCRWMSLVLFAQPFYWLLVNRMRFDQELVADHAAARQMDPLRYAEWLIHWSRRATSVRVPAGPLLAMAAQRGLKSRVAALLNTAEPWEETAPICWGRRVAGGLAMAALSLSLVTSRHIASQAADLSALSERPRLVVSSPQDRPSFQLTKESAVEVIAMRSHPCDGNFWWDLEGKLIVDSGPRRPSPQYPPEVIVRVLPLNDREPAWAPDSPLARRLDSNEVEQLAALGVDEGSFFAVRLATGASDVELPLTTTQWTTRSFSTCAEYSGNEEFKYDPCTDADDLVVSVTHSSTVGDQLNLLAMDRNGTEHAPTRLSMSNGEMTAVFGDLQLQDAQCFYVQSRPQVRVSLRQLPLAPGQADALVEIEPCCFEGNTEGQL